MAQPVTNAFNFMRFAVLFLLFVECFQLCYARGIKIDPEFLFIDEDFSVDQKLPVSVCSENVSKLKIISGDDDRFFVLVPTDGRCADLILTKPLDADQLHGDGSRYQSFYLVFQGTSKNGVASLEIQVADINDNAPEFRNFNPTVNISKNTAGGTTITKLETFDPDTGIGGIVKFFIDNEKFEIANEKCQNHICSADVVLRNPLRHNSNAVEHIMVVAKDGASLTSKVNVVTANLTVNVAGKSESPSPACTKTDIAVKVLENLPIGSKVYGLKSEDYESVDLVDPSDFIELESESGILKTSKIINYEEVTNFNVSLVATLKQGTCENLNFNFVVVNEDDNLPMCVPANLIATWNPELYSYNFVSEDTNFEAEEIMLHVVDLDKDDYNDFDVSIAGSLSELFTVDPKYAKEAADITINPVNKESLENEQNVSLTVVLTPKNKKQDRTLCSVNIVIPKSKRPDFPIDHVFIASNFTFNLTEETEGSFMLLNASMSPNELKEVELLISAEETDITNFFITEEKRLVIQPLDLEEVESAVLPLNITAYYKSNPTEKRFAEVVINLLDTNEFTPKFSNSSYSATISCSALKDNPSVKISAVDDDFSTENITYTLSDNAQENFVIDQNGLITIKTLPENIQNGTYLFTVFATDNGIPPKMSNATVVIVIETCNTTSDEVLLSKPLTPKAAEKPQSNRTSTSLPTTLTTTTTTTFVSKQTRQPLVAKEIKLKISENLPVGTKITDIGAEAGQNEYEFYLTLKNFTLKNFLQLTKSGELFIAKSIDFEFIQKIEGNIYTKFDNKNMLYASLEIEILDLNDNGPIFNLQPNTKVTLLGNASVGTILNLTYPLASDADLSYNFSSIEYSLKPNDCFQIDSASSVIQLIRPLSECLGDSLTLTVIAIDNAANPQNPRNFARHNITVNVKQLEMKQNKLHEMLESIPSEITVFDDALVGNVLFALDLSKPANASKSYQIKPLNSDIFQINQNGEFYLQKPLKRYVLQKLCTQVEFVIDLENNVVVNKTVCFTIKPRPRSPTVFWPLPNSVHKFKENVKYDILLLVNATSSTLSAIASNLTYHLVNTTTEDEKYFSVDSNGALRAKQQFDFEFKRNYLLIFQVCDTSCTNVSIRIEIEDVNDHWPMFVEREEQFSVPENQEIGAKGGLIAQFSPAEDGDGTPEKRSICYKLETETDVFYLPDQRNATLYVRKSLDREERESYVVVVSAIDCYLKESDLLLMEFNFQNADENNKKSIIINVTDVNDNFPRFVQKEYYGQIIEGRTRFGAKILRVEAVDPDLEAQGLRYYLSSAVRTESDVIPKEEAPFHVESTTGNIISRIANTGTMPRSYNFRVVVCDNANHEDETSVTITVINYSEQIELTFDQPMDLIESNQKHITKLMNDITTLYMVVNDIRGHGNVTIVTAHFLEKDKLLATSSKAIATYENGQSKKTQKARQELRRAYALRSVSSSTHETSLFESSFISNIDSYTLAIGFIVITLVIILIGFSIYVCRHRRRPSSKLAAYLQKDLFYNNGDIMINTHKPPDMHTMHKPLHTSSFTHSQRLRPNNTSTTTGTACNRRSSSNDPTSFETLQSTEL